MIIVSFYKTTSQELLSLADILDQSSLFREYKISCRRLDYHSFKHPERPINAISNLTFNEFDLSGYFNENSVINGHRVKIEKYDLSTTTKLGHYYGIHTKFPSHLNASIDLLTLMKFDVISRHVFEVNWLIIYK
ncbi:hypothetical protein V1478_006180 [Vespula squamosa]|uniref:Uncharacterized protein n=1 Tax=Vespula squamosa TaxID=30214 RepID=A0ABD2B740_VESSQ